MDMRLTVTLLIVALSAACSPEPGTVERVVEAPGGATAAVQLLSSPGGATIPFLTSLCLFPKGAIPEVGDTLVCPRKDVVLYVNGTLHGLTIFWRGPSELELGLRKNAQGGGFVSQWRDIHVTFERW